MDKNAKNDVAMQTRILICFILCLILLFGSVMRVATVATEDYSLHGYNNVTVLSLGKTRGTVYDRNYYPLTNTEYTLAAAVMPTEKAVNTVKHYVDTTTYEKIKQNADEGKASVCTVGEDIDCEGIVTAKIYSTDFENMPALHLIGYTDRDGCGKSGLQAAYDGILNCKTGVTATYEINGKGKVLKGVPPTLCNLDFVTANAIVTTLDINIQRIAEVAAEHIEKGAVIVADAETNKIRAAVSRPSFDAAEISEYLNAPASPLLDRTVNTYNVGSVFKPCVAAAGIENGCSAFKYNCEGSCKIGNRIFNCHNKSGHGIMELRSGLANSCNTYFYNFAKETAGENILRTARALNFGKSFDICEGITVKAGNLPETGTLLDDAALANFSIGQGELLLSPIAMLNLYSAIASDGCYFIPSVIDSTVKNGAVRKYDCGSKTRAMSRETAEILKDYLRSVLEEGTGKDAKPKTVSAAGKTATAQTGRFEGNSEICAGWFCGFFPLEKPRYTVIVFSEDTSKQDITNSKIFALIADGITELGY